jgi:hypothetical protein
MKVRILPLNKKLAKGYMYTLESVEQLLVTQQLFGRIVDSDGMNCESVTIADISHWVTDLEVEDGWVIGTITFADNLKGNRAKELMSAGAVYPALQGYGCINSDNIVEQYEPLACNLTDNPTYEH